MVFAPSVLDPHNIANFKPLDTDWEVEGKRGFVWVHLGYHTCKTDLEAVRHIRKTYKYRTMRVRNSAQLGIDAGRWRVIRFKKEKPCVTQKAKSGPGSSGSKDTGC